MLLKNRYEYNQKTDLLGSGGFGRVYLAHDTFLDINVALKIVSADDFPEHYSLIKEVKKGISLSHSNLVRYLDAFELKETTNFGEQNWQIAVMEYVPDGELSSMVFKELSSEQQHNLVLQLLDGLNYLHKEGIIHRDLKPSNILLHKRNKEYIPKICDFGISKQITGKSSQLSQTIGSPSYVPPEYFENDKRISFCSDLWSFGVLLHELFIGTPAFGSEDSGHSTGDVLNNIINCKISSEINSIPEPFQRVIRQCLVKDRKERVQSCEKLIDMIKSEEKSRVLLKEANRSIPILNKDVNKTKKIEITQIDDNGHANFKKKKYLSFSVKNKIWFLSFVVIALSGILFRIEQGEGSILLYGIIIIPAISILLSVIFPLFYNWGVLFILVLNVINIVLDFNLIVRDPMSKFQYNEVFVYKIIAIFAALNILIQVIIFKRKKKKFSFLV